MNKTVCLDAGHYGKYNRSPAVPAYYESEAMWQLQQLLKTALEAHGIAVKLTRQDQTKDLYITDRGRAAKGCDLFLSLHSNAVGSEVNEDVDYPVVYHLTDDTGTDADDISKALAQRLAPVIAQTMETGQAGRATARLAKTDKNKDGSINDNYYGVLNGARQVGVPGLILEHSFHTNTRSATWLMAHSNLVRLAEAEAKVIAEFLQTQQRVPGLQLRELTDGHSGADVRALQILLEANGCKGNMDSKKYGSFGPKTEAALQTYQKKKGLPATGRANLATWASLLGVNL